MLETKRIGAVALATAGYFFTFSNEVFAATIVRDYANGASDASAINVVSDDGSASTADVRLVVASGVASQSGMISYVSQNPYPNGPFVVEKTGAGELRINGYVNLGGTPAKPGYFYARAGTSTFLGGADLYYLSAEGGDIKIDNAEVATDITYIGTNTASTLTLQGSGKLSSFTSTVYLGYTSAGSGTINYGAASGQTPVAPGTLVANEVFGRDGIGNVVFNHTSTDYSTSTRFSSLNNLRQEAGTTTLTDNANATNVVVAGGSLSAFNTLSGASLTVSPGATVRASTLEFDQTSISGKLGAGTETMRGQLGLTAFTFNSDTTLEIRAGAIDYFTDGETTNDSVLAFDTLHLGGTLSMVFDPTFRPAVGDKIHIIDFNPGIDPVGNFGNVVFNVPGYAGEMVFDTTTFELPGFSISFTTGNLLITSTTAVPEPGSIALLAVVGTTLFARRRR